MIITHKKNFPYARKAPLCGRLDFEITTFPDYDPTVKAIKTNTYIKFIQDTSGKNSSF